MASRTSTRRMMVDSTRPGQRPGEGAKGGTHHQADGDGDQRCRQGMHRAVNHPRPQVAPQLVGTQPVVRLRRQAAERRGSPPAG